MASRIQTERQTPLLKKEAKSSALQAQTVSGEIWAYGPLYVRTPNVAIYIRKKLKNSQNK